MKEIVLCDNGEYLRVADLCQKFNLNVDIDAFHNPFADLCFGSKDSLIREATKKQI